MLDFDETKCMYFMINEQKVFNKYMEIWEEVTNITKKNISELIYSKKYLTAKKHSTKKKAFNVFIEK